MKRKNTLKLASYSACAIAFLGIAQKAEGQIFHTDIIPDIILDENGEMFQLDINFDAINDLEFNKIFLSFTTSNLYTVGAGFLPGTMQMNHIYAMPLGGASLAGAKGPYSLESGYPYADTCGVKIFDGNNWVSYNSQIIAYSLLYKFDGGLNSQINDDGFWFGGELDKYVGIRVNSVSGKNYGWIRMDVSADNKTVTIKDYAFNATANDTIIAGAPIFICQVDIEEKLEDYFQLYTSLNTVVVELKNQNDLGANFSLFSTSGQLVYDFSLNQLTNTITFENISSGIYIARLISNGKVFAKQLYISVK